MTIKNGLTGLCLRRQQAYAYDANRLMLTTQAYAYDANRLILTTQAYAYDANRLMLTTLTPQLTLGLTFCIWA